MDDPNYTESVYNQKHFLDPNHVISEITVHELVIILSSQEKKTSETEK